MYLLFLRLHFCHYLYINNFFIIDDFYVNVYQQKIITFIMYFIKYQLFLRHFKFISTCQCLKKNKIRMYQCRFRIKYSVIIDCNNLLLRPCCPQKYILKNTFDNELFIVSI